MKEALALVFLVSVLSINVLAQTVGGPAATAEPTPTVDPEFAYPDAPGSNDLGTVLVRSLAGRAVDAQGNPLQGVLVERLSVGGRRVDATFTDAMGEFRLRRVRDGQYSLRLTYPGCDTVLVEARTSAGNTADFELTLEQSF